MNHNSSIDALLITVTTWIAAITCSIHSYHELSAIMYGFALAMTIMLYFVTNKPK